MTTSTALFAHRCFSATAFAIQSRRVFPSPMASLRTSQDDAHARHPRAGSVAGRRYPRPWPAGDACIRQSAICRRRAQSPQCRSLAGTGVASAAGGKELGPCRALTPPADAADVDWALDMVGAGGLARTPTFELSGGERQRLLLSQALLDRPNCSARRATDQSRSHPSKRVVEIVRRLQKELGFAVIFKRARTQSVAQFDRSCAHLGAAKRARGRR